MEILKNVGPALSPTHVASGIAISMNEGSIDVDSLDYKKFWHLNGNSLSKSMLKKLIWTSLHSLQH